MVSRQLSHPTRLNAELYYHVVQFTAVENIGKMHIVDCFICFSSCDQSEEALALSVHYSGCIGENPHVGSCVKVTSYPAMATLTLPLMQSFSMFQHGQKEAWL